MMIDKLYKHTPVRNTIRLTGERNNLLRLVFAARLSRVLAIKRRTLLIHEVKTGRINGKLLKEYTDHRYDQLIDAFINRIKQVEL